jgi:hypothetical protein
VAGVLAGLVGGWFWPPLFAMPAAYAVAVVLAALAVGRRPGAVARLLVVYPVMHMAWGVGFLAGR